MSKGSNLILDHDAVLKKLERISHQIIEDNYNEDLLTLVGVSKKGYQLAQFFQKNLSSKFNIDLIKIELNKTEPTKENITISPTTSLQNKKVILIDDVLNTGKTLMYAAAFLTNMNISSMKTIVLVDRRHRSFPIRADWVGLTLSTTLQEHISVEIKKNKYEVYLN